jgi:hypothetical protein
MYANTTDTVGMDITPHNIIKFRTSDTQFDVRIIVDLEFQASVKED